MVHEFGRRTQPPPRLAKEKLGFPLVDLAFNFGPTSFRGPKPMRCEPTSLFNKPRSATLFTLSSLKQESCRSLTSYGRGHHRLEKSLPLFGFYFQHLQILVTSSSMGVNSKSLRNSGILIPNLNYRRLESGLGSSIPKYHSPTISYIDQKHYLIVIAHKFLKSHDTLAMNSNGQRIAYGLGSYLANSHSLTILYSDFNHHPFANSSNAWTLSWYVYLLHVSNLRQALCGMLNLHGQGIHVREDPPVSLQFYTYHFMNPGFNFTCPHHLDLMLQRLFCEFSKRSKPYALVVKQSSIDYITIVFRIFVVALLWVVHLAPARINASILSSTSQSLMTVTILSSFESFEDDLSINHDLTCVNVLPSSCLTALLVSKSMNFIYLLMALGNVFYCTTLNFGSLKSFFLYLFLFG
ncbi:unnamed protein product [Arabidopsis lyrata]|nr:unnamed protein product [Arabidopsis lyrata]